MPSLLLLLVSAFVVALFTGCGGGAGGATLSAHDIELPGGVESVIPFPADASVRTHMDLEEDGHSIVFSPGLTWPEAVSFFSDGLASGEWTVTNESLPEREEGERTARWSAEGHGVSLNIEVTAFGGRNGFNMNGFMMVTELD